MIRRQKQWIALFSQSGKEIADLAAKLGRDPDMVMTNNMKPETYAPEMTELLRCTPLYASSHDKLMAVLRFSIDEDTSMFDDDCFFTLHGYLRIIPADVCESCEIYNGHPGLITRYPELKGKDPQEIVYCKYMTSSKYTPYDYLGSVVHQCTAELDGGKVLAVKEVPFEWFEFDKAHEHIYNTLRQTSLDAWYEFMKGMINGSNRDLWSSVSGQDHATERAEKRTKS